jgi:hypothetical protein
MNTPPPSPNTPRLSRSYNPSIQETIEKYQQINENLYSNNNKIDIKYNEKDYNNLLQYQQQVITDKKEDEILPARNYLLICELVKKQDEQKSILTLYKKIVDKIIDKLKN